MKRYLLGLVSCSGWPCILLSVPVCRRKRSKQTLTPFQVMFGVFSIGLCGIPSSEEDCAELSTANMIPRFDGILLEPFWCDSRVGAGERLWFF